MSDDVHVTGEDSVSPSHAGPEHADAPGFDREVWGTRLGFIMAAVGSAVGLGNMWRFPYRAAESGGAGFVLLYILFTFLIGIPVMLAEFTIGRRSRLSPVGGLRKLGGSGWSFMGYLFVASGFLILAYYSVIAGWVTRYALEGILTGFPAAPGDHFGQVTEGFAPILYHLVFMIITIVIVMGGIEKGIERASVLMMPALFLLVAGLAIWAGTLSGSGEGYSFYLSPSWDELLRMDTIANAAGQAFFSLSLGMGAMLTFSSYLSKKESLPRESTVIAFADFGVAFTAGLMVFPIIFALGLQDSVGESTVGALFISLPGAFVEMGGLGRAVGVLFFLALFVGAVTSAISLLEVVTSSVIDEWKLSRTSAAVGAGVLITLLGLLPATNIDALGAMDAIASEVFLPLGGLGMAIFVGWRLKDPLAEVLTGSSEGMRGVMTVWLWLLRVLVPVMLVIVLWQTVPTGWNALMAALGGGGS